MVFTIKLFIAFSHYLLVYGVQITLTSAALTENLTDIITPCDSFTAEVSAPSLFTAYFPGGGTYNYYTTATTTQVVYYVAATAVPNLPLTFTLDIIHRMFIMIGVHSILISCCRGLGRQQFHYIAWWQQHRL